MTVPTTFRSDITPLLRMLGRICLWGMAALLVAGVIGQLHGGRFPSLVDLLLLVLVAPGACIVGGLFFYAMVRLFPVQILAGGLRCYDGHGRYHVVSWTDISHVQRARMYGLPYLLIASPHERDR